MRNRSLAAGLTVLLATALLPAAASTATASPGSERRVIVMLSPGTDFKPKGKQHRRFDRLINAVALTVPATSINDLRKAPGVIDIFPDMPVKAHTEVSTRLIGATEARDQHSATGEGVRVAVIDTGVDSTHPDLAGRVVGGYDFVNNDADPMDDHGHGTHVAGIIAGKAATDDGVTGVAPAAEIVPYKALNQWGEGYTSDIVASIEAAAENRVDVINMSLGGPGDGSDPIGLAATAAANSGIVVIASAGNSGPGRDTIGSPAAAEGVIAVGASTSNLLLPTAYLNDNGKRHLIQAYRGGHSANPPADEVTAELVRVTDWATAPDVRGKIVLMETRVPPEKRYVSPWDIELAREAENRGAIALLGGYPGFSGGIGPVSVQESGDLLVMDRIVVMGVDSTQYDELAARVAAGPVRVTLTSQDATDQIAPFSSRGPSPTFGLKPEIVAPGVEIRSTVPAKLFAPGQYRMSGTSMAAPHVAGAAALLRQLNPRHSLAEIKSRLVNSSKPLMGTPQSASGSGRLDIMAAIGATLTADPPTLSFGLADLSKPHIGGSRELTLRNSSDRAVKARLDAGSKEVRISRDTVEIPAGGSVKVTVTVKAANPGRDTEISGLLTVNPESGAAIRVPYLLVSRPLVVQTSPDPSDGTSVAYVFSYAPLASAPRVNVKNTTVTARHEYGNWYIAELTAPVGAHTVTASATTTAGQVLTGEGGFEVTPEEARRHIWEPVGPLSVGGDVSLSPSNPQQAVMTQYNKAGPWLTTDSGETWRQLNRLPLQGAIGLGKVVVDANRSERFWYAVNDPMTGQGKVLRTDDRGKTWKTLPVPAGFITTLVADPQTRVLVAVTDDGVIVSTDAGDTWTAYASGVDGGITHASIGGDDLYLGTFRGVWVRRGITSGTPGEATRVYDPGSGYLYAMVANGNVVAALQPRLGVVGSYDGGQTWSTLLPYSGFAFSLMQSGDDLYMYDPLGGSQVSHDNGRNWSALTEPVAAAVFGDYERWADGSITLSSEGAGVYRGTGDTFTRIGVQGGTVGALAFSGDRLLAGTPTGLYTAGLPISSPEWGASGGEGWIGVTISHLAVSPSDPQVVWRIRRTAFGSFTVDRSGDGGLTWTEKGYTDEVPTSLAIHPADPERIAVGFWSLRGAGLYTTVNGGATWKNLYHGEPFEAIAGDPADPQRWWLGSRSGLYRSDDGGSTVTKMADGPVSAVLLDGDRLVIGGSTVRFSTDGGRSWREGDTGGLPIHVSQVIRVGGALYAATSEHSVNGVSKGGRGVLRSVNGGRTWHSVSGGLQNLNATRMAASPDGQWLYVGTVEGGVHRLPLK